MSEVAPEWEEQSGPAIWHHRSFSFVSPLLFFHRYFRKGCYFGLACFANMAVESTAERGARMKSVGIMSTSYTLLYRYMSFLEHQVR